MRVKDVDLERDEIVGHDGKGAKVSVMMPPQSLILPGYAAHLAPFFRDASAAVRLRYPHRAGIARACGRGNHDDLHACAEQGRARRDFTARYHLKNNV